MTTDKPITVDVLNLLGAVGAGVLGFRIGGHIGKRDRQVGLRRKNPSHPELIDDFVISLMARARKELPEAPIFVRREAIAAHLEVPEHFVSQAFERLNKLGIVGPESNEMPHDVVRGERGSHGNGWNGSIRRVHLERLDAYLAQLSPDARPAESEAVAEADAAHPRRRRNP